MSEQPLTSQFEIENAINNPVDRARFELEHSEHETSAAWSDGRLDEMRAEAQADANRLAQTGFESPEMSKTPEIMIPSYMAAYGKTLISKRNEHMSEADVATHAAKSDYELAA